MSAIVLKTFMNILNFLWRDNLSYFLLNSRQIMCPDKREKTPHVRLLASLINSQVLFWEEKKKRLLRLLIAVELKNSSDLQAQSSSTDVFQRTLRSLEQQLICTISLFCHFSWLLCLFLSLSRGKKKIKKIKDLNSSGVTSPSGSTWETLSLNFSPRKWVMPLQLLKLKSVSQEPGHVVQIGIRFSRYTWRVEVVTQGRANFSVID